MFGPRGFFGAVKIGTAAAALVLGAAPAAHAESVRSAVANHLANELPGTPSSSSSSSESSSSSSSDDTSTSTSTAPAGYDSDDGASVEQDASPAPPPAPVLVRPGPLVFGRRAFLDVSIESRVQVWLPAQHPSVHVAAAPYRTYSLELAGGIEGLFSLRRLALETDGSTWIGWRGPAVSPAGATGGVGAAAALAMVGLPFLRLGSANWWEPIVRYEVSSYATTATPSRPVCLVARDANTSADPGICNHTSGALRMASRFESLLFGVHMGRPGGLASFHAGVDLVWQRKPYQVNVDGRTLDDYLFDARFGGTGLGLGFGLGRDQGLSVRGGVHLGSAWVSLTDDLALGDVLPAGWELEYLRWDATVSYGLVLWKGPPLVQLRAAVDTSGSEFLYTRDDVEETPTLSRDLFFGGRLALVLML